MSDDDGEDPTTPRARLREWVPRPETSGAATFVRGLFVRARMFGDAPRIAHYELVKLLDEGGMGVVVLATDTNFGEDVKVALKVLDGRFDEEEVAAEARAAWLGHAHQEAKRLMEVRGEHVVGVYHAGISEGFRWLAMEYIEGVNLERWLEGSRRSWEEIVRRFVDAARGLQSVHSAGLVHRDFKPRNAVLDVRRDRVCVIDFGLVTTDASAEDERDEVTLRGTLSPDEAATTRQVTRRSRRRASKVYGTALYMSPEQARGEAVDARSDQFSFCLSLYWALYGRMPFDGEEATATRVERLARESRRLALPRHPPTRADAVPRWLHAALQRGMSHRPDDRYPSMSALIDELTRDRARPLRLAGAAAAVFAATLAAAVGLVPMAQSGVCRRNAGPVQTEADAAALRARYAESEPEVPAALASFAASWAERWDAACDDHFRGGQPGLELRQQCLHRQRRAFEQLTARLLADDTTPARAREAVRELDDPAMCDAAGSDRAKEASAAQRDEIAAVDGSIASARAAQWLGDYSGAQGRAKDAVAAAAAIGHAPTEARALLVAGEVARHRGDLVESRSALVQAHRAAIAGRDVFTAVAATHELVRVAILDEKDPELAGMLLAEAAGHLGDIEWDAPPDCTPGADLSCFARTRLWAEHVDLRGLVAHGELALESAGELHGEAVALWRRLGEHGDVRLELARSLTNHGRTLTALGRRTDADAEYREARQLMEALYGPEHPALAPDYMNQANRLRLVGAYEAAVEAANTARRLLVAGSGEDSVHIAQVDYLLGVIWMDRQDRARARRHASAAAETYARHPEAPAQDVVRALQLVAAITMEGGDRAGAAGLYAEVARRFVALEGADVRCDEALAWIDLGKCTGATDPVEARRVWIRAEAALERAGGAAVCPAGYELSRARGDLFGQEKDHTEAVQQYRLAAADPTIPAAVLADVRWGMAQNMVLAGLDRLEARRLAGLARDAFAAQGRGGDVQVAVIERWLAAHSLE